MSDNNTSFGIPHGSRTPAGLNSLFVDVFHEWLCENTLTFDDFTGGLLHGLHSFYTKNDVGPVTSINLGYGTPNSVASSSNEVINSNVVPTHGEIMFAGFSEAFIDANWENVKKSS